MVEITPFALPGILADIARLAGVPCALKVARTLGGRRYHFPRDPQPTHPLCDLIGRAAALMICQQLGGERHAVPSARTILRFHDAQEMRLAGASISQISQHLAISESHVCRLLQGLPTMPPVRRVAAKPKSQPRKSGKQLDLF